MVVHNECLVTKARDWTLFKAARQETGVYAVHVCGAEIGFLCRLFTAIGNCDWEDAPLASSDARKGLYLLQYS